MTPIRVILARLDLVQEARQRWRRFLYERVQKYLSTWWFRVQVAKEGSPTFYTLEDMPLSQLLEFHRLKDLRSGHRLIDMQSRFAYRGVVLFDIYRKVGTDEKRETRESPAHNLF